MTTYPLHAAIETTHATRELQRINTSSGENGTLADISTGDIVTVTGILTGGGTEPTIDAKFVRK